MKSLLAGFLLLSAAVLQAAELPAWISPEHQDHPRVGQVLDLATGRWLQPRELVQQLRNEQYVLLGEKHDNPDHHSLQLWLLKELHAQRPQGAFVMEMLAPFQQPALNQLHGRGLPADGALREALQWGEAWDWDGYGALVRWGLKAPQQLLAANLDREEIRAIYQTPPGLAEAYDKQARERIEQIIADAHCGKLPAEHFPAMASIQQARDQRMAEVMALARPPALLVSGSFHVRKDIGVPLHWSASAAPVVVIFAEAGGTIPGAEQADYIWLTAAMPAVDHCADW
ncbi:MAG TPA: iron(III) ABC transporter [Pseudomonas xinjiangensis]|uniref:Iron(III) ABC transporter n=2 Tax=root TaxID=1 RepID=A0A7V1BM38_9GAMM|nr:iron(III) ABC transporter [Halopseudomonas xinjiangensis]HEC46452.1 iron(III) ABC transporter [Halopseudomonas xinjiangensis]